MAPFGDSIVWSSICLLGWFSAAAAVGAGLRRLGVWSTRTPATKPLARTHACPKLPERDQAGHAR